jgi:hypothetical protein
MEIITSLVLILFLIPAGAVNAQVVEQMSNGALSAAASADAYVNVSGDTMTGPLTLSGSSLTVTGSAFSVGGSTLVVSGGKVGIGTAIPSQKLNITQANTQIFAPATLATYNVLGQLNNSSAGTGYNAFLEFNTAGAKSDNYFGVVQNAATENDFVWAAYSGSAYGERMRVTSAGLVGIGTTAPSNALHVKATTGIAVSSATTAGLSMVIKGAETKANIKAYDPVAAGELWICTDCTAPYSMCVSTGTAATQYALLNTATACE